MDIQTWNRLTDDEQMEVKKMSSDFIKKVLSSSANDGWDFSQKFEVRQMDDTFCIYEISTNSIFGDFKSKSQKVIDALMTDAIQNYGR